MALFVGTSGNDTLPGSAGDDSIRGLAGNDSLSGDAGNDTIDGGVGNDTMVGGTGNDLYFVGDVVTENDNAGIDAIRSSRASFTLPTAVEDLILDVGAHSGTGNALANAITGNAASNTLDGGAGADTLAGGGGNDTYLLDHVGDVVEETFGAGSDVVRALVSHTLEANVETLILVGDNAIDGTGNEIANRITGNTGNNRLDGKAGADTLAGGDGNDTYVVDDKADLVSEAPGATGVDLVTARSRTFSRFALKTSR